MKKLPHFLSYLISLFLILIIWGILARFMNASLILPSPLEVIASLFQICSTKIFWLNFLATFLRVIIAFLITVLLGTTIGIFCGFSSIIKILLELPLSIIRATPVVAFILAGYYWFTSNTIPVFISILMALPVMISAVSTGFEKSNRSLMNMAQTFQLSKKEVFFYIKLPDCLPFWKNGLLSTFGNIWKIVAAGEVLCLPKLAVGTMMQRAQVHLETSQVIAQTVVLVTFSFILERLLAFLLNRSSHE